MRSLREWRRATATALGKSTECANPTGTLLAQRGFGSQAQSDRRMSLNCENIGGRGRYRTADRWCVKGQDSMDYRSGVSNRCRSAEFRCPVCAVVSTLFVPVLGHSWPTGGFAQPEVRRPLTAAFNSRRLPEHRGGCRFSRSRTRQPAATRQGLRRRVSRWSRRRQRWTEAASTSHP